MCNMSWRLLFHCRSPTIRGVDIAHSAIVPMAVASNKEGYIPQEEFCAGV